MLSKVHMRYLLPALLFFLLSSTSCEKQCVKADINFRLIGFSEAEADTIIVRKFAKNSSFAQPLDTAFLDHIVYDRSNDTLKVTGIGGAAILFSEYNYQLFFPGSATLMTITDIHENEESDKRSMFDCNKSACVNTITSYTVNGQASNDGADINLIYLKK
jgi:hypothetical protein